MKQAIEFVHPTQINSLAKAHAQITCSFDLSEASKSVMSQSIPTGYIPPGNPRGLAQKTCPGGSGFDF